MVAKYLTEKFLKQLHKIEYGSIKVTTPDDKQYYYQGKQPGDDCDITLHDWSLIPNMIYAADDGFTQNYRRGSSSTSDLTKLCLFTMQNERALSSYVFSGNIYRLMRQIGYYFQSNTLRGSKKNISAHYDLGNEFYKLWLDPSMTYSSAIYKSNTETLEQAQQNKYDRILNQLGDGYLSGSMLEIGCGWGGFAERALQHKHDLMIKGITISKEQADYCRTRLQDNAYVQLEDYRKTGGAYDYIVSIEMLEAVGQKYWPIYFAKLASLLKRGGRAVIQTITIDPNCFDRYVISSDLIRTYIFPGGLLPTLPIIQKHLTKAGLRLRGHHQFGHDYAKTLKVWLDNFDSKKEVVLNMGFDEQFIRLWRLYLASCIASFNIGRTDVMQLEVEHA